MTTPQDTPTLALLSVLIKQIEHIVYERTNPSLLTIEQFYTACDLVEQAQQIVNELEGDYEAHKSYIEDLDDRLCDRSWAETEGLWVCVDDCE